MELTTALNLPSPNVSAQCDETSDVRRRMQGGEMTHSHDEVLSRSLQQVQVQMCTRAARYTIDLIFASGTDVSGVKAVITGWVNSKLPPECPFEELALAEGSFVSAIYYPTEDEVSAGMPVSCPEWTLQAIAGLSTETQTDVVLANCLIPTPSPPKPPTLPPTPGGIVPGGITPSGITPDITPILPPAHDDSSAPLGAIIGGVLGGLLLLLLLTCCCCWWFACCCFKRRKGQTKEEEEGEAKYERANFNNYGSPLYIERLSARSKNNETCDTMPNFDDKEIEVVQESNMPAGPLGLATSTAFMYCPILCTSSRDISCGASRSVSHTQGSRRDSQIEAIPQVSPRLDSRSSANLYSSSCAMPAAAWMQRASLDVSTVRSRNQDPTGSANAPDWNIDAPPQQGPMVKPYAYPREPRESISQPYMTAVLSSLAATSASKLGPSIRTSSRNNIRTAMRSKSHTQSYSRGSQVEASPQGGSRWAVSSPVNLSSSCGSPSALSVGTCMQRASPPPPEAVSPPVNLSSSSGSPRALSTGAWMLRTSLDGSTDSHQKQSSMQSDYAQDCHLATSPRQALIEPDSYPEEQGGLVSNRGSTYSTPGSVFSGRSLSTPGGLFSHSPDRGSEMGPVLPTRKSHKRTPISFRTSSTSYLEVATQVADRAKSARLSNRKSHSWIDKGKTDRLSRLSGSCYMPGERRAYNITSSGSTGYPVTAASSHSCFKRKTDIEVPKESVGRDMLRKNAWTEERTIVAPDFRPQSRALSPASQIPVSQLRTTLSSHLGPNVWPQSPIDPKSDTRHPPLPLTASPTTPRSDPDAHPS
eukprot:gene16796-23074_t